MVAPPPHGDPVLIVVALIVGLLVGAMIGAVFTDRPDEP